MPRCAAAMDWFDTVWLVMATHGWSDEWGGREHRRVRGLWNRLGRPGEAEADATPIQALLARQTAVPEDEE